MEIDDNCDIRGLDAYPELKVRRRFPTKKHMLVEYPRHYEIVDVVFSRNGRPLCLEVIGKDECDFCWAYNLTCKKDIPESHRQQILEEAKYWQSLRVRYREE